MPFTTVPFSSSLLQVTSTQKEVFWHQATAGDRLNLPFILMSSESSTVICPWFLTGVSFMQPRLILVLTAYQMPELKVNATLSGLGSKCFNKEGF